MGLLLAGHSLLRKAITGWSFEGWVTPAVLFYSGTLFRKLLENVISGVIQINYRLNICIGNLNSWLYFLTVLSIFLNGSCSEDAGKQVFIGNPIEKYKQHVINWKSCVCVYIFLLRPLINSIFIILFWWFQLAGCKMWMAPAKVSMINWLTLISERCTCLFPLFFSQYWVIHSNCQVTSCKIYFQVYSLNHSLWLNIHCNLCFLLEWTISSSNVKHVIGEQCSLRALPNTQDE